MNEGVQGGIAETLTSTPKVHKSTPKVHTKYTTHTTLAYRPLRGKIVKKVYFCTFFLKSFFVHNKDGKRQTAATENLSTIIL